MRRSRIRFLLLTLPFALPALPAASDEVPTGWAEDALPADALLSGEEIYRRVLENRLDSYEQDARLVSADRGGSQQQTRMTVKYQSFKNAGKRELEGVHSKTRLEYVEPFDLRHTTYLVIDKEGATNDQFVYLPTHRRIRRVNLRGEAVFGSDFSFEDVLPRELEDAAYARLPDESVGGVPCFVVEAIPNPKANSEYSRFQFVVEKARYVPLQIRYWNEAGVFFKELQAEHASIERHATAWVPMRSTMRNVLQESWSRLFVDELVANPDFPLSAFSLRGLEGR
ncbi:MAG: outer membrane lipoprotein-sorting protein [Myxococcales bacterium]|nr:outer membrane lipoprotein-sorting protein [Myxococcales bacterium]